MEMELCLWIKEIMKASKGKREKAVELKSPMIKSARKKGEISADNKGQKTLPEGVWIITKILVLMGYVVLHAYIRDTYNKLLMWAWAKCDSTKITTPDNVEE